MAVTIEQVKDILTRDEPNYMEAAQFGPEAIPHLQKLLQEADPLLASKAAYLASMINSEQAVDVVKEAATSEHAQVRAAAAAATRNLLQQKPVTDVLSSLLDDGDVSVRKVTLKSIGAISASGADLGEGKPKAAAKKGAAKKGAAKKRGGKKGAKKGAAAAVADEEDTSLFGKVRRLAEEDADPYIREIANDTLSRFK